MRQEKGTTYDVICAQLGSTVFGLPDLLDVIGVHTLERIVKLPATQPRGTADKTPMQAVESFLDGHEIA